MMPGLPSWSASFLGSGELVSVMMVRRSWKRLTELVHHGRLAVHIRGTVVT